MLKEDLPNCICGSHDYSGGGGYCGPGLSYTSFSCCNCGRYVMEIHPWVFYSLESKNEKTLEDYVNDVIMPLLRVMREEKTLLTPPQIPECMNVFLRIRDDSDDGVTMSLGKGEKEYTPSDKSRDWVLIDSESTKDLSMPVDPIGVKHREFWKDTVETTEATEIPNQYYNDRKNNEPWYTFVEKGAKITYGPRKRVISIKVERESPFMISAIAKLAERDDTSFWADEDWHNFDKTQASAIEIHAWGKEKFDEYLQTIRDSL